MSISEKYTAKLVERFGVGAKLMLSVVPHSILYDQLDVTPGQQLEIRRRFWQLPNIPGLYTVTIKSETEIEEIEMEGASAIFREEWGKQAYLWK